MNVQEVVSPVLQAQRGVALSATQRSLWFQYLRYPELKGFFNIGFVVRIEPGLELERLRAVLDELVRRHSMFRVSFASIEGEALQQLRTEVSIPVQVIDVLGRAEAEIAQLIELERHTPFDVSVAPLVRAKLFRARAFDVLMITFDHLVCDGWSGWQAAEQICAMLKAGSGALHAEHWQPGAEFFDYMAQQREWLASTQAARQLEYWRGELLSQPVPALDLAYDRNEPETRAAVIATLDAELVNKLRRLASRHGISVYVALLAPYLVLLQRLTGQSSLSVGAPMPGRSKEWHSTVGFFANTVVLRAELTAQTRVADLLKQVRGTLWRALKNQSYPYSVLMEQLRPARDHREHPFFQVWFNHQNARIESELVPLLTPIDRSASLQCGDLLLRPFGEWNGAGGPGLDFLLETVEVGDQIRADFNYNAGRFEHARMQRYLGYWRCLVEAMVANDEQLIDRLPMLSEAERQQLLYGWNPADSQQPEPLCVHERFEAQVIRTPEAIAVVDADKEVSYRELNARANQLARRLQGAGVAAGDSVAVLLERSIALVIAELAVLKCGAAYVPVDVNAPRQRQRFLISDSGSKCVLESGALHGRDDWGVASIDVDAACSLYVDSHNLGVSVAPDAVAYVMYTSGSTGTPKGVAVSHRGIVLLVCDNGCMQWEPHDRVGFTANPAFDATTGEVWGTLLNGAQLMVIAQRALFDAQMFAAEIQRCKLTVLFLSVGLFNQLIAAQPGILAGLRYVWTGGDALDPKSIAAALRSGAPAHLLNCYGPTEGTVFASTHEVDTVEPTALSIPIGRPIKHSRIYVLDWRGEPAPIGVRGEIYIGGAGVARGYVNHPALTAERFLEDPFLGGAQRMYRTGDLGCWRADGILEFQGRNDAQVKIRGFRIELGEIETRLRDVSGIDAAVVVARAEAHGEKRLIGYYVGEEISVDALRAQLSQSLPEYMVPAAYVRLAALPLTASGKLDRAALPAPGDAARAQSRYAAPQGVVEEILAQLWCELLRLERVGRDDHFFELGGHSLLALKLIELLRQRGLHLDVRTLFDHPTLATLATRVTHSSQVAVPDNLIPQGCAAITPQLLPLIDLSQMEIDSIVAAVDGGASNVQDIYPLTSSQEGILFHHLMEQQGDAYVLRSLLRFDSRQRIDEFVAALAATLARHDVLRTAFQWEGLSQPVQVVWRHAELAITTLELNPAAGSGAEQLRARFAPHCFRLDVSRAPLLQVCIARDPHQPSWLAMLITHHLIQDNTALKAMVEEMRLHLQGRELPAVVPYRNFVAQLRAEADAEVHDTFFREMLGNIDEPTLPFGLEATGSVRKLERARHVLAAPLSQALRTQARMLGVSVASVFHLAWARLVGCAAGREQAVFGTVLFGRMHAGAGAVQAIGMFTNTLPICIAVDGGEVRTRVLETHRQLARLLQHENASLALAQRCSAVTSSPLFSALFNYRHGFVSEEGDVGWPGAELLDSEEDNHYPLRLHIDDREGGFTLTLHAPCEVGAQRVCELMQTTLASLIDALEQAPHTPVNRLRVLPASEQQLLHAWNEPYTPPAVARCVHEWFEVQAERTPEVTALIHAEQRLSYNELNCRANQLARYLRSLGVKPEQRVALSMERSIEMVIGVLAILKAGGTYVPLEPSYPAARLQYILQDSAPSLLLTQRALRESLPASSVPVLEIDAGWDRVAPFASSNLPADLTLLPSNLACITYTSGSTGQPKGVMADHARTVNRVLDQTAVAPLAVGEVCAHRTAIGFVDSIFETLHPLLVGATLVIMPNAITVDLRQLAMTLDTQRVTRWITVPSLAAALLADVECVQRLQGLRHWLFSGEALNAGLLQQLRQQLPRCSFINIYGSSEAADATYYIGGTLADESRVPIGRPLANTQIYILDALGLPVPVGVVGEIHIGGASLARGYLNLPELTAQRFLENPFSDVPGARMYRTGDLGRWRADGLIEYLGRNDHQIKIRGFRIELGEIEARLRTHQQLKDVVVAARAVTAQDKHLVAYYVSDVDVGADSLRSHLAATLPDYMLPAAYVRLPSLPLSPNGKLDRRALPAPDGKSYARASYDAPQGEMETRLAQLWMQLLKVERVGRRDNFFELGGHSLLAVSLSQLIRVQLQVDLTIADVFEHPVLTQLAARVTEAMLEQFDADELLDLIDN